MLAHLIEGRPLFGFSTLGLCLITLLQRGVEGGLCSVVPLVGVVMTGLGLLDAWRSFLQGVAASIPTVGPRLLGRFVGAGNSLGASG